MYLWYALIEVTGILCIAVHACSCILVFVMHLYVNYHFNAMQKEITLRKHKTHNPFRTTTRAFILVNKSTKIGILSLFVYSVWDEKYRLSWNKRKDYPGLFEYFVTRGFVKRLCWERKNRVRQIRGNVVIINCSSWYSLYGSKPTFYLEPKQIALSWEQIQKWRPIQQRDLSVL